MRQPPNTTFFNWIHDEAADGSSRVPKPITRPTARSVASAEILATRSADGGLVPFDPEGVDGSQVATAIALASFAAYEPSKFTNRHFPTNVVVLTGPAEVIGSRLTWPASITAEQRAEVVAQLAAVGIAVI